MPQLELNLEREALREDVMSRIDRIQPVLEENAGVAERLRTLPEASWSAIDEAGLFALKVPTDLGGLEADATIQIEAIERLAYIDGSTGWAAMVGLGAAAMAAGWAQDAALDLLRDGDRVRRGALLLAPSAKAEPVEGGYDISGRWSFASGSSHAEWIAVTAMVDGARPPVTTFILDADAVTIHDNWHVTGLKGSGSADVSVDHAFAPSENILAPAFGPPLRGGPVLRMGQPGLVVCEHVGFALGVVRRMLDEITELGRTKARGLVVKKPLAENNQFQAELGQADVRLRATRAYALDTYDRAHRAVAGGATLSDREQLDLRLTGVLATDVALDICNTLIRYAGTTGLYSGNPIERAFRDIHAGSNHHLIAPEAWEAQGRTLLGDDSVTPLD